MTVNASSVGGGGDGRRRSLLPTGSDQDAGASLKFDKLAGC